MRTVKFLSVMEGAAQLCGFNVATDYAVQAAALAKHITSAYRLGWEMYDWPESLSYVLAEIEVNAGVSDSRYIPYTRAAHGDYVKHDMKTVFGVSLTDPRVTESPEVVRGYRLGPDGIYFPGNVASGLEEVWVEYRKPASRFTWTNWETLTNQLVGDLVYSMDNKEVYLSIQASAPKQSVNAAAYWEVVPFMALLDEAVMAAAHAAFTLTEGKGGLKRVIEEVMLDHLESEIEVLRCSAHEKRWTRR